VEDLAKEIVDKIREIGDYVYETMRKEMDLDKQEGSAKELGEYLALEGRRQIMNQLCERVENTLKGRPMSVESDTFEVVKSILGVDKVKREDKFEADLGASSLDMTEIIMNLEDKFKITIPNNVAGFDTVGDAVDFIEKNVKK